MNITRVLHIPATPPEDTFYLVRPGSEQIRLVISGNDAVLVDLNNPPPTLKGPREAYYNGSPFEYEITNYRDDIDYVLSSPTGTLTRSGKLISYTPFLPVDTSRYDTFHVNGRQFVISVLVEEPLAPQVLYPPDQSENIAANTVVVESSIFNTGNPQTTDQHVSSDWEIATDPDFTNIVASSYNDTTNLTTWDPNV